MSQPSTRDLSKIVDALRTTESELRFQVSRLTTKLKADFERTGERDEFLTRLCKRYDEATGTIVTLRRYQEGRQEIKDAAVTDFPNDVNDGGVATAYTGDE